jgi:hypothetical protein
MKTLKQFMVIMLVIISATAIAKASGPEKEDSSSLTKIYTPVYRILQDNDVFYYIIKVNGENVLMDNQGKVIRYLCDDEHLKSPESYQLITVPVSLLLR